MTFVFFIFFVVVNGLVFVGAVSAATLMLAVGLLAVNFAEQRREGLALASVAASRQLAIRSSFVLLACTLSCIAFAVLGFFD